MRCRIHLVQQNTGGHNVYVCLGAPQHTLAEDLPRCATLYTVDVEVQVLRWGEALTPAMLLCSSTIANDEVGSSATANESDERCAAPAQVRKVSRQSTGR